ncbi:MAG: hypothetical protein AAF581_16705 [Planctomycetota bacterium]
MTKTPLADVAPDSILAQAVLDTKGRILLKEGAVLSPKLIKKLQKWGIHEVHVEGASDSEDGVTVEQAIPALTGTQWSEMFAPFAACPEMDLVHRALRTWKASRAVDVR